jgi:prepilin-type N-terminal cleavage/methylation domain-containing protein
MSDLRPLACRLAGPPPQRRDLWARGPLSGGPDNHGFTLLELMIAIAIAGFTVGALYALFSVQSRQLATQDLQMEMNQNARFAADMMTRSMRLAGYASGGYVYGVFGPNGVADEGTVLPAVVPYEDPGGDGGPDAITVVYAEPSLMMDTRNDIIEDYSTSLISFRAGMLDYNAKLQQYAVGDLLLCSDYADMTGMRSYLWTVSAVSAVNGTISVDANSQTDFVNMFTSDTNLTPIMTCSKGSVMTFYIDDDSDGVGPGSADYPVLMLDLDMDFPAADDVPLVDNIEDLQLEYCVDDGTGTTDCSLAASWVRGDSIDPTTQAHLIWMVRINLIARSSREEFSDRYPGFRPALSNRAASGSPGDDHYYRKVMVTEVTLRNIRALAAM